MFWKRASFWTALASIIVYWDQTALHGGWVYDDAGSVIKNVVVNGVVDWKQAFTRDFWGTEMKDVQSHKSFRPLTTLTLKANYVWAMNHKSSDWKEKHPESHSFRVVNLFLHGVVTALITESTSFVLPNSIVCQLIVGFLFGLHPVHAEVVSNVTSRGEMLMSFFFLLAFLSYASSLDAIHKNNQDIDKKISMGSKLRLFLGIYIFPWLGMTMSLFSKEQGATALITCVAYDFLKHHGNLIVLKNKLIQKDSDALHFVKRTIILAVQTISIVLWRQYLNGETSPDFIEAQNPAGFAKDRFTRAFSVSWVYCLYIRDAIYPFYLCPDWSGLSIDLISTTTDPRAIVVICLWYFAGASFWSMVVGNNEEEHFVDKNKILDDDTLSTINMAIWAFTFSPFLLSSNILVVVGLMKADRVIYLPLFGFCLLEALLLNKFLLKGRVSMPTSFETRRQQKFWFAHFFLMYQLIIFSARTHERNLAWSNSLSLWGAAYRINPRSHHTMYNYGYELSIKQRYAEAEAVMRPIGDARVEGPSNTFVYTMVLYNLGKCEEANELLDIAFDVIEENRRIGGPRNTPQALGRTESNLLVARAHCADDMQTRAQILYSAVQADPSNEYAVNLAHEFMQKMEEYEKLKRQIAQGY